ncbi:MAG: hypothetical protein IPK97_18090 [Ahniella sp.]|nr:hypothetical protein [Ahniella sp.]
MRFERVFAIAAGQAIASAEGVGLLAQRVLDEISHERISEGGADENILRNAQEEFAAGAATATATATSGDGAGSAADGLRAEEDLGAGAVESQDATSIDVLNLIVTPVPPG